MRLFLILALTLGFSVSHAAGDTCLQKINRLYKDEGAPFAVLDKELVIEDMREYGVELDEDEAAQLISYLRSPQTEAYVPYDSSDAGAYVFVVQVGSCKSVWSGFIYNH